MNKSFVLVIVAQFLISNNNTVFAQLTKTKTTSSLQNRVFNEAKYRPLGNQKWAFKTDGKIFSSPIVHNGVVYIGSEDGFLYAIDEQSGKIKWKFKTGGAVHSSAAIFENTVYVGSFDGYYYAIDLNTARLKWKFKTGGEQWSGEIGFFGLKPTNLYMEDLWDFFLSSPVVNPDIENPNVFFGSSDGNVYALNALTGKLKWKFKTNGSIHCSPVLYNNNLYIGSWDANLYAINIETGKESWRFETAKQTGFKGIQSTVAVSDGLLYFGARDPFFFAVNAETGKLVWKYDAENSWVISSAAVVNNVIYVGSSDTYSLLGLDAKTGNELFKFKTNGYVYSSPAIAGETAYFGDFTGNFFALNIQSPTKEYNSFSTKNRTLFASEILNNNLLDVSYLAKESDLSYYNTNKKVMDQFYKLGAIVSSPFIANNTVYFGSSDGYCYAIELQTKDKT